MQALGILYVALGMAFQLDLSLRWEFLHDTILKQPKDQGEKLDRTCLWLFWTSMKALEAFSSMVEKSSRSFFILSDVSRPNGTKQVLISRSTSIRSSRPDM